MSGDEARGGRGVNRLRPSGAGKGWERLASTGSATRGPGPLRGEAASLHPWQVAAAPPGPGDNFVGGGGMPR